MSTNLRLATAEDLAAGADTLTSAFMDYPWTRWVIPEDGYGDRLRTLQNLYLAHAHQHGVVLTTADHSGVIALLPPDTPEPGAETIDQIVELHGERIERLSGSAPRRNGWTLETLGVHADRQGQGLGSALISRGLREAAARGARTVRLETSDLRNVRLYERHGFLITGHVEGGEGPPVWAMEARLDPLSS